MKNHSKLLFLFLLFFPCIINAQRVGKECIDEILKLEEKNAVKDFDDQAKPIYINYTVKTTDWDDETIVSNVKVFRGKNNTHFFSEQGSILQDENEVFMILPTQKLIIINSTRKELYNQKLGDQFYEMRRNFLDSCEVVRCEPSSGNPKVRILELKVKKKQDPSVQISKMIYEYNTETEKIINTKVFYNPDFKVKSVLIVYNEINLQSDYKFLNSKKYVLDRNNKLLSKYNGYELVDNRKK